MTVYPVMDEMAGREARAMHLYRAEMASFRAKWHLGIVLVPALGMIFLAGLLIAFWNAMVLGLGPTLDHWGDFSFLLDVRIGNRRINPAHYQQIVSWPLRPLALEHMLWMQLVGFVMLGTCLITGIMSILHFAPEVSRNPAAHMHIEPVRLSPPIEVVFESDRGHDRKCVIDVLFTAPGPASAKMIRDKCAIISGQGQSELQNLVDNAIWQLRVPQLQRHLAVIAARHVPRDVIHDLRILSIRMHDMIPPPPAEGGFPEAAAAGGMSLYNVDGPTPGKTVDTGPEQA